MSTAIKYLMGLMVMLVLLEAGLRASGKMKTYTERIDQQYFTYYGSGHETWFYRHDPLDTFIMDHGEFAYEYITNAYGIRERAIETDTSPVRLFVFGDSFTEGMGAPYDSAFPREIERLLLADGYGSRVSNLGVNGGDPFYYFMAMKHQFSRYRPTHVIFAVNSSDLQDYVFRGGMERFLADSTVRYRDAPLGEGWYRRSHVARFAAHAFLGVDGTLLNRKRREAQYADAVREIHAVSRKADSLCAAIGAKFLLVTFPMPSEICGFQEAPVERLHAAAGQFRQIDLSSCFTAYAEKSNCMDIGWKVDGHFNGEGYMVLGNCIYRRIGMEYPMFWE